MYDSLNALDPAQLGDVVLRLLLSPAGVLAIVCFAFAFQSGLRILGGVGRPKVRRARPTTWTRF